MFGILGRPGWMLVMLAGAIVIPYVLMNDELGGRAMRALSAAKGEDAKSDEAGGTPAGDSAAALPQVASDAPASPSTPICDMATALRFDVTPQEVAVLWPRVTTVLAETSLSGMRVPLVTGVMPDDLVGSLTYYFDDRQRVQKITFAGSTGDPRRLVALMTGQYGLKPQPTMDAGLYQTKWNGQPISTLHIRHASVLSAEARHGRYDVALELKRADANAGAGNMANRLFGW